VRSIACQNAVTIAAVALLSAAPAAAQDGAGAASAAVVPAADVPSANGAAAGGARVKSEGETYDPKVFGDLEEFCSKWMGFLAVRERDNRQKIQWQNGAAAVRGTFVGYSSDYECLLKKPKSAGAIPVATIKYMEYLYQQDGPSPVEAAATAPRVVETTEVTEIFRYSAGKWVY
jgi:hypothetical protein